MIGLAPALLEIQGLTKTFPAPHGDLPVLGNLDVTIAPGEHVVIVGPSGCGKSTFQRILAGLNRPTSVDRVLWRGEEVTFPEVATKTSLMPQSHSLLPWLTVEENIAVPLRIGATTRVSKRQAVDIARQLLADFDLVQFAGAYPHMLSGGMASRVAFLRTMVLNRELVLLDEPFAAVDTINRERLQQWLDEAWRHLTGILNTHSLEEAVLLGDRVIVMGQRGAPIVAEVTIDLPHPRDAHTRTSSEFISYLATLRHALATDFVTTSSKETR